MDILKCDNSEYKSWEYLTTAAKDGEIYETDYPRAYLIVLVNVSAKDRTVLFTDGLSLQLANPYSWQNGKYKRVNVNLCFEIKR